MSTILRALQKKKIIASTVIHEVEPNQNIVWRGSLLSVLVIIIILLSIILYKGLIPQSVPKNVIKPLNHNPITKVIFLTQKSIKKEAAPKINDIVVKHKKNKEPEIKIAAHGVTEQNARLKSSPSKLKVKKRKYQEISSAQMEKRFAAAVNATEHKNVNTDNTDNTDSTDSTDIKNDGLKSTDEKQIADIQNMSNTFQQKVPEIRYESHVYSSNKKDSWIKINNEKLKEGDVDRSGKLKVVDIEAQKTIFRLGRKNFSLESLVDWNVHTKIAHNRLNQRKGHAVRHTTSG